MKEHPILMSTIMVQALLAGRKTKTRRIVRARTPEDIALLMNMEVGIRIEESKAELIRCSCPYGKAGDVLYVREEFYAWGCWRHPQSLATTKKGKLAVKFVDLTMNKGSSGYRYCNDAPTYYKTDNSVSNDGWYKRNSLFMPKSASRIWLQVESVKVERLQDITEGDAIAEGIGHSPLGGYTHYLKGDCHYGKESYEFEGKTYTAAQMSFHSLFISINGEAVSDANPWVWVVSFKILSTTGRPSSLNSECIPVNPAMIGVPVIGA